MDYLLFKNPNLRYRREDFGGIAKLDSKTIILSKKQYLLIESIKKMRSYGSLNSVEKNIVDKFLEENILLKIEMTRAKILGFKDDLEKKK